ncbi:MAG TPA: tryptophan 2,3-dioxygenase family protein [Pseudonocardiaceae bacterium]|nr:tryptophan 2,3-dioxygenase family protein [Pseudonocardiaceae bacterium]
MTGTDVTGTDVAGTEQRPTGTCPFDGRSDGNGDAAPYVRFASLEELHDLQFPSSDSPFELSFILITQVKELLFRMLYVELDVARSRVRDDDIVEACRALARAQRVQHVLLTSWETLTGMSATDFTGFRSILGEASGIQSFMYRALEFILGNKDEAGLDRLRRQGWLHQLLDEEIPAPSLYDEAIAYLHRTVRPMPDALLRRDFSRQHESSIEVETGWQAIYHEPDKYPAGYQLAEALTELSYLFAQWRATHLLVVERMLGRKPGTGGTEGVDWLRHINEHRFFPELWSVRTKI